MTRWQNETVSEFFTALTSISEGELGGARSFGEVADAHAAWIKQTTGIVSADQVRSASACKNDAV